MATEQELAKQARKYFKYEKRGDKQIWTYDPDKVPEWVRDMTREAHDTMMADDYKFEYVVDALEYISDADDLDDLPAFEADVYTSNLISWLGSNVHRVAYADDAIEEYGEFKNISDIIMAGQVREKEEVYASVLNSLKEQASEE